MSEPIKIDFSDKGKNHKSAKEVIIPPDKAGLKIVINIILTLLVGAIVYYFMLPAINPRSPEFYMYIAIIFASYIGSSYLTTLAFIRTEYMPYVRKHAIVPIIILIITGVVFGVGYLTSCPFFRAKSLSNVLQLDTDTKFEDSISVIDSVDDFQNVPMIDKDAAYKLADKTLGTLAGEGLESQFELADEYSTQINYKGQPYRVYPLAYGDIFKWITNTSDGFPGYIIVNMNTQNASYVKQNIRYSPTEHFQKNLVRQVRFHYPTAIIGTASFEIDDNGVPYWIVEILEKKVGLIGGDDVKGAVLVNASTGECKYYSIEEVSAPDSEVKWIDQVYDADLLIKQYTNLGKYSSGFWNSIIGQSGVKLTTSGFSYLALNDDVYMYTGVTSVTSDESLLGFLLINQRTKDAYFYSTFGTGSDTRSITGATEKAAQQSAEGVVSDKKWTSTFLLLINLDGEATYFMALKDDNNVVKSYAMVNVENYNVVAIDSGNGTPDLGACMKNYAAVLKTNKDVTINVDTVSSNPEVTDPSGNDGNTANTKKTVTGAITEILSQNENGNTCYYIKIDGANTYFMVSASTYPEAIFLKTGDTVAIEYLDSADSVWTPVSTIEKK